MSIKAFNEEADSAHSLAKPIKDRLGGKFSGPFIIALLFAYWELPIYLFSNKAQEKIDLIHSNVGIDFKFLFFIPRPVYIILVWIFWIFATPLLIPFFTKISKQIEDYSLRKNNHESFKDLKDANQKLSEALSQKDREYGIKIEKFEKINKDLSSRMAEIYNNLNTVKDLIGERSFIIPKSVIDANSPLVSITDKKQNSLADQVTNLRHLKKEELDNENFKKIMEEAMPLPLSLVVYIMSENEDILKQCISSIQQSQELIQVSKK